MESESYVHHHIRHSLHKDKHCCGSLSKMLPGFGFQGKVRHLSSNFKWKRASKVLTLSDHARKMRSWLCLRHLRFLPAAVRHRDYQRKEYDIVS